jgi:hypothetical protein
MAEIQAHGLAVSTPAGWEGRIFRRPTSDEVRGSATDGSVAGAPAPAGEIVSPVLHVATIPLAADVADYASDAVDQLGPTDAIVVLKEFDPSETQHVLFAPVGLPRDLDPDWFGPASLQRTLPGQAGLQRFFQESGRAFCLYVVLGAYARRNDVVPTVNAVLTTIRIDPAGPSPSTAAPATTPPSTDAPGAAPTTGPSTTTVPTTTTPAPPSGTAPAPRPGPTTTTTGAGPAPSGGGAPR